MAGILGTLSLLQKNVRHIFTFWIFQLRVTVCYPILIYNEQCKFNLKVIAEKMQLFSN